MTKRERKQSQAWLLIMSLVLFVFTTFLCGVQAGSGHYGSAVLDALFALMWGGLAVIMVAAKFEQVNHRVEMEVLSKLSEILEASLEHHDPEVEEEAVKPAKAASAVKVPVVDESVKAKRNAARRAKRAADKAAAAKTTKKSVAKKSPAKKK